jgi:hypothetical protein
MGVKKLLGGLKGVGRIQRRSIT